MATSGLIVPENAPDPPDNLTATAWLVADLDTGAVLGACGPHEYRIPASTQKLLLALALLDELDPDQEVDVVREDLDFEPGSSAVGLLDGGTYTVETLWLGLLLNSGNDAANMLARVGGGERGVAGALAVMNGTAELLGARQTHAATPSGLDGAGQFSSAYDLALIARQLFNREDFLAYVSTERADIPAQPPRDPSGFQIQNQDPLLFTYEGALGGKTGYTDLARHSYVGAAERDGRRLVVTVLGAEARPVRPSDQAAALLDWGFSLRRTQSVGRLVEPGEVLVAAVLPDSSRTEATDPAAAPPGAPEPLEQAVVWIAYIVGGVALAVFVCGVLLMLARPLLRRR
jgi:D-alanyl-D-alanine carboxypeptidase (penicillin-binding protein 5/6)